MKKLFTFSCLSFAFAALVGMSTKAEASSSYYTSFCSSCHGTTVSTCNGCHAHGTHSSSGKSDINVTGTTNKSSYAPGETVSVTITGGYRTGWVRAVLYNQNNVEVARSTGSDSGMGSSTTLPAVLTAPAPATPGTYTWKAGWYGNKYDAASATFGTGWTPDATNPNHGYELVSINTFTVAAPVDATAPVISSFTLPATTTSLTVPVTTFAATDNVGVTGYCLTVTNNAATCSSWPSSAPANYIFSGYGQQTLYAFVRDAAGNVSASSNAVVNILHKKVAKDFDGDSKADLAVWDTVKFNWFILKSTTNVQNVVNYGTSGDMPVSGDYDGDGKADIAVWRPSNGNWYIINSSTGAQNVVNYGTSGDIPVPGDYDGDGKADIAVWRPSNGSWYIINSSTGTQSVVKHGTSGDIPVIGDYDGDGKADIAVWRPSNGSWYIINSSTGTQSVINYGTSGDIPVPGDYDGVGRTEIAIWRPAEGNWYILDSVAGTQHISQMGIPTDQPIK